MIFDVILGIWHLGPHLPFDNAAAADDDDAAAATAGGGAVAVSGGGGAVVVSGGAAGPGCAVTSLCSLQVTDTAAAADSDACGFIFSQRKIRPQF